ncbi:MAG: hypothetical protein ACK501_23245 [Planctomycetota bacterium]|jgi:hypothetical protein
MPAVTPEPTTTSSAQRVACWLLAVALLLQAIWLPFHLATERHLAPVHDARWAVGAANATDTIARPLATSTTDEPGEPPHSVLDHQDQKHVRHDEPDDARQPAVAGDDDGPSGDEAPLLLWLDDAALHLPIGRAPPQFAAVDLRPQIRSPLLAAAQPRAPPHG